MTPIIAAARRQAFFRADVLETGPGSEQPPADQPPAVPAPADAPPEVDPAPTLAEGQFRALVAVFGNKDSYGEVIAPGAFTQTLAEWEASGDAIPVIWSHSWGDPFAHIGTVITAQETAQGLEVVGEISADERGSNPLAARVYELLKQGRIRQFSFAYDVLESSAAEHDGHPVTELRRLQLHEVGPCLVGVNQSTELYDIKAAGDPTNPPRPTPSTSTPEDTTMSTSTSNPAARAETTKAAPRGISIAEVEQIGREIAAAADGASEQVRPSFKAGARAFGETAAQALTGLGRIGGIGSGASGQMPGRVQAAGLLPVGKADGNLGGLGGATASGGLVGGPAAFDRTQPAIARRGLVDLIEVIAPAVSGTGSPSFTWLTEQLHANRAAVVPAGQKKPTSDYELVERQGRLKWIATLSKPIHRSLLADYTALKDFLTGRMSEDLYEALEAELMTGDGGEDHLLGLQNVSGVRQVPFAVSLPRTLREARTRMAITREAPTAWMLHPTDAAELDLWADSTGQFIDLTRILGGLPIVENPGMPQGVAVLADWTRAAIFTDGNVDLTVMDGTPHYTAAGVIDGSLWEHNQVALRAEMRVGGLAITRPSSFAFVGLNETATLPGEPAAA